MAFTAMLHACAVMPNALPAELYTYDLSPSVRGWLFVITKSSVVRRSCLDHRGLVWK